MPRIVSDELFYKVQEVLKVKKNPQAAVSAAAMKNTC